MDMTLWWIVFMSNLSEIKAIYRLYWLWSVFLFVLLSVASSELLSYRKCRRMRRLYMMINNKNDWESSRLLIKFKVKLNTKRLTSHYFHVAIRWTHCFTSKFCCALYSHTKIMKHENSENRQYLNLIDL